MDDLIWILDVYCFYAGQPTGRERAYIKKKLETVPAEQLLKSVRKCRWNNANNIFIIESCLNNQKKLISVMERLRGINFKF